MKDNLNLTLFLIRHGETPTNKSNATIGQPSDEPLNDTGKSQAKLLGDRLRKEVVFDAVYASSYLRASDTLKLADPKVSGICQYGVEALREISQGDYQGKNRSEFFGDTANFERMKRNGMGFSFPGGETQFDVLARAWSWLEKEVLNNPFTRTDKHLNIGLFTHGMVIKCLLTKILGSDHKMNGKIAIDNTSISKARIRNNEWWLDSINDTAHLFNKDSK